MFELLDQLLHDYKRNLQKMNTKTTGRALIQRKEHIIIKVNRSEKTEIAAAKKAISSATKGLEETVKGQFSKKVVQVLEEQKKMVEKL